ncbi:hypothetical protein BLJAPNOD_06679 [Ensifer sp. M14]|nr:hypothetical protein B0E45_15120 [Sinorhizobium sp. A49]RDL46485.1 hypothetical protein BLJAPNOD_06679 [Ensifer sp. M14]
MIEMEERDPTLCDCTIEIAELLASMPAAGVDGGSLFDLLADRLETSRDRLQRPGPLAKENALSERAVPC